MIKYLLALLLLPTFAMAFPVPKELVDAVITVTTKDGKVYTFSANTHKVVKRTKKEALKLTPTPAPTVVRTEVVEERHTGIISVYAVQGQRGLDHETKGNTTEVSTVNRLGVGAMYQHRLGNSYLGVGGDSNSNLKLIFGLGL